MPDHAAIEQLIHDVGAEAVQELFDIFKMDAEMRLDEIRARLDGSDLHGMRLHAHSLKGICRTYALPASGDLAFALEKAAEAGDIAATQDAAGPVLDQVPAEIAEVMVVVKEMTADRE